MNSIKITFIITTAFFILACSSTKSRKQDANPKEPKHADYVSNAETAIKVAEAIWLPMFGKEIYDYKPFVATLKPDTKTDSIWVVKGTSPYKLGGEPTIYIRKLDCKILLVNWPK